MRDCSPLRSIYFVLSQPVNGWNLSHSSQAVRLNHKLRKIERARGGNSLIKGPISAIINSEGGGKLSSVGSFLYFCLNIESRFLVKHVYFYLLYPIIIS